jgi:membrane-associated phospholipid phosphatase
MAPELSHSFTSLPRAAANRIMHATRRLFRPATRPKPQARPAFERPLVLLITYLVPSLLIMFSADLALGLWMRDFPDSLEPGAERITMLGEGVEVLVSTGLILLAAPFLPWGRMTRAVRAGTRAIVVSSAFVFLAVAGGGLTALLAKYLIGRPRPLLLDEYGHLAFRPFAWSADFSAFPSGHSATAGAMAIALALVFPRWRAGLIVVGVMICLSRQLVGMHWPSDTLMGFGVGAAFTYWLAHVFARRGLLFRYDDEGFLHRHPALLGRLFARGTSDARLVSTRTQRWRTPLVQPSPARDP